MHSPSAHRALRPGQKLFANESNFRLAYTGIINQIRLTINHSGLFYTLKTVKSPFKVKHFVNFANFSVNFGLFLLRFFTVCQFFRSLPCPAHKAKASALRRPGRIADAFLSRSISPQQKDLLCRPACEPRCADVVLLPVSHGFCYMVRLNLFTSCQISNGSCHFQYSVIGSG